MAKEKTTKKGQEDALKELIGEDPSEKAEKVASPEEEEKVTVFPEVPDKVVEPVEMPKPGKTSIKTEVTLESDVPPVKAVQEDLVTVIPTEDFGGEANRDRYHFKKGVPQKVPRGYLFILNRGNKLVVTGG